MSAELDARIKQAMAEMRAEYLAVLPSKMERLSEIVERARRDPSELDAARSEAHRLHGTAGSYGFAEVGRAGGRIEAALDRIRAHPSAAPEEAWEVITRELVELRRLASEER